MKFYLYINPDSKYLQVVAEGQHAVIEGSSVLVAERDPDEAMLFERDCAYYNPLLKRNDALQLFLVDGENKLIGYNSGRPPGSMTKAEHKACQRGWFKFSPRPLSPAEVPTDILIQLKAIPKMKGVLSQALRTRLGLRVPEELEAVTFNDWISWLGAQRMAVPPSVRASFELLKDNAGLLRLPEETKSHLLTGQAPEPKFDVRMRYCEIRTSRRVTRGLYESYEHTLSVPKSVLEDGKEALLSLAQEKFGSNWALIQDYPTGIDIDSDEPETSTERALVVFVRASGDAHYQLWAGPKEDLPNSIHDIFAKVIGEQENNAKRT